MVGRVSADKTIPILKAFVENGGTIVAIGSSTSLGYHFGLPIANHMTEKTADDREIPLAREKFYGPGSHPSEPGWTRPIRWPTGCPS